MRALEDLVNAGYTDLDPKKAHLTISITEDCYTRGADTR